MQGIKFDWLKSCPEGLYCQPADCFIDPARAVPRALITHGHADHARPGHEKVLATKETLKIMKVRYPSDLAQHQQLNFGEKIRIGEVTVWLAPAGHILGSAQVVMEYQGQRAVVSGDYKRQADPTAIPFEPITCDLFVTEATFALPVFRHPKPESQLEKLLSSLQAFSERPHLLGVYGLGKCQRILLLLRDLGFDAPIYLHGALVGLTELYRSIGFDFGNLLPVQGVAKSDLSSALVLAPPSATIDRWSRRFTDPRIGIASGWMQVRGRARQRRAEIPLIISDHADWDDLLRTCSETQAETVWITHGREDALAYELGKRGQKAIPLRLSGRQEESE